MKSRIRSQYEYAEKSHPPRGAWIEICLSHQRREAIPASHPTRGAWIEIERVKHFAALRTVAPHPGCVD